MSKMCYKDLNGGWRENYSGEVSWSHKKMSQSLGFIHKCIKKTQEWELSMDLKIISLALTDSSIC